MLRRAAADGRSATPGYLDRLPERLVVDGFRLWTAGYRTGDIAAWARAWDLYAGELGTEDGRAAVGQLAHFTRAVLASRPEPPLCLAPGCRRICRDECLAVAAIAACQHEDGAAFRLAIRALAGAFDSREPLEAAIGFAGILKGQGRILMPVPAAVIAPIAGGTFADDPTAARPPTATLH